MLLEDVNVSSVVLVTVVNADDTLTIGVEDISEVAEDEDKSDEGVTLLSPLVVVTDISEVVEVGGGISVIIKRMRVGHSIGGTVTATRL